MKEKLGLGMVKAADCVVNVILYLLGIVLFLYGGYTLWDTHAVYADASPEQYAAFHPENGDSYTELMRQNPEVIGWLTIDNTNIDYPLTQADNNSKYVNTDAKGNSSLSGSLFLDCRNQKDFSDFNLRSSYGKKENVRGTDRVCRCRIFSEPSGRNTLFR